MSAPNLLFLPTWGGDLVHSVPAGPSSLTTSARPGEPASHTPPGSDLTFKARNAPTPDSGGHPSSLPHAPPFHHPPSPPAFSFPAHARSGALTEGPRAQLGVRAATPGPGARRGPSLSASRSPPHPPAPQVVRRGGVRGARRGGPSGWGGARRRGTEARSRVPEPPAAPRSPQPAARPASVRRPRHAPGLLRQ